MATRQLSQKPMSQTLFEYKVRARNGQVLQGTIHGTSQASVTQRLQAQGYTVLSVSKPQTQSLWQRLNEPRGKVPSATMALFSTQFAVMLSSGMSVVNALQIVGDLMKDPRLRNGLERVRQRVLSGSSLGAALAADSKVFPPMLVQTVEAGEVSGSLNEIMERLAAYYEREAETKAKVKEALTYPTIVAVVGVIAVIMLVFFVLPQFVTVFEGMNMELPLITQLVLDTVGFILQWWWVILLAFITAFGILAQWIRSPKGHVFKDTFLMRMPVIGPAVSKFVFSRMCRSLSLLTRSGVPIVEGLRLTEKLVLNIPVANALARVRNAVERGVSISAAMAKESVIPRMLVQMVQVGEESGSMDTTLDHLADFYDREAAYAVKTLTTMIEPIMIVGMTVVVLILALAVVIPMFQMNTSVPGM